MNPREHTILEARLDSNPSLDCELSDTKYEFLTRELEPEYPKAYRELMSSFADPHAPHKCGDYAVTLAGEERLHRTQISLLIGSVALGWVTGQREQEEQEFMADPLNPSVPVPKSLLLRQRRVMPIWSSIRNLGTNPLDTYYVARAALVGEPTPIFDQLASA